MERFFNQEGSATYYLRAIPGDWTSTEQVETGQPHAANETLQLPFPRQDEAYLDDKIVPGVLAQFQIPGVGQTYTVDLSRRAYLETTLQGVLLGWDEKDYFVRALQAPELQAYDTARPAQEIYHAGSAQRIPHDYLLNVGQPEVEVFPTLPLGVYAAFCVPVGYSRIQIHVDDVEVEVTQQKSLLPSLFAEMPGDKESSAAAKAGLVLSRTSLLVDGLRVNMLVPLCQLES